MDWKRVKSILILLLLVTNAVLAVSIYSQFSAHSRDERQSIRSAIELVRDTLLVEESVITALPREIYALNVARDSALEDAFAQKLLGSDGFTAESGGGGINRYWSENGRGEIKRGGEIDFLLFFAPDNSTPEAYLTELLAAAGLSLGSGPTAVEKDGSVSFAQHWEGHPISGYSLVCSVSDEGIQITGSWLISDSWTNERSAPSSAELVIRLASALSDNAVTSMVSSIRCGYHIESSGGQDSRAIPVWLVETGGVTFTFNVMSGQIIE